MKKLRKILAMVMVITMATAMFGGLTAKADTTGTIEVTAPMNLNLKDQDFQVFRIFNLDYYPADNTTVPPTKEKFVYKLLDEFEDFDPDDYDIDYKGEESLANYLLYLLDLEVVDAVAFDIAMTELARALYDYIEDNHIPQTNHPNDPANAYYAGKNFSDYYEYDSTTNTLKIKNLPYGYYLVYGSAFVRDYLEDGQTVEEVVVASCALTSTKPVAKVTLKADVPDIDKDIWNDHSGSWKKWNDVSIGDDVEFMLTSKVPKMTGYAEYTFTVHDFMSAGLTFYPNSVDVYLGGTREQFRASAAGVERLNEWTKVPFVVRVADDARVTDGCTFEIVFDPEVFVTFTPEKEIYIYYSAILNSDAVIEGYGNPNDVRLEYSSSPFPDGQGNPITNKTQWKRVKVYTGKFGFLKTEENKIQTLPDAEFEMYEVVGGSPMIFYGPKMEKIDGIDVNIYKVVTQEFIDMKIAEINKKLAEDLDKATTPAEEEALKDAADAAKEALKDTTKTLTTPASGVVLIQGLGASYKKDALGYYYLIETKAPEGYFLDPHAEPILVRVDINFLTYEYLGKLVNDDDYEPVWTLSYYDEDDDYQVDGWVDVQSGRMSIINYGGPEFPPTGGIGRAIFITGGIALMGLAVVGLVVTSVRRKKRMIIE